MDQVTSKHSWLRRIIVAGAAAVACTAAVAVSAEPAAASGTYSLTGTVNVRTGPGTGFGVITTKANGASFTLNCQWQGGSSVSGNKTWDYVTFGDGTRGAVTDYWTTTPSWNSFAPNTGQCYAVREQHAVNWARSVIGNSTTNGDLGDSNHVWNGWCDNFVGHAFGKAASGYATAIAHYNSLNTRGLINTPSFPFSAPAGALVFFAAAPINNNAGHVMLSEGNGYYITTAATIREVTITWPGATYLGWSYADPEWPGR
jgi:uncharacterized protein YraI